LNEFLEEIGVDKISQIIRNPQGWTPKSVFHKLASGNVQK